MLELGTSSTSIAMRHFLTRAFRRPVDDESLHRYVRHVMSRVEAGDTFTNAMKSAAASALSSPRFLYLYERASNENQAERLDDFELASRLSQFLWGSIPDQILLDLAAEGKLHDQKTLNEQLVLNEL